MLTVAVNCMSDTDWQHTSSQLHADSGSKLYDWHRLTTHIQSATWPTKLCEAAEWLQQTCQPDFSYIWNLPLEKHQHAGCSLNLFHVFGMAQSEIEPTTSRSWTEPPLRDGSEDRNVSLYKIGPNYTGVQKFLYTIEIIAFFNTKHQISRQQTNWSR